MGAVASRNLDSGVEWATPRDFLARMAARFGPFDLDPAATADNAAAPMFYTKADDGLKQPWFGRTWCNCPYGRQAGRSIHGAFVMKAIAEHAAGHIERAVLLLPASTDTAWLKAAWAQAAQVIFLTGRLRFNDGRTGGTFPSCVVVLERGKCGPPAVSLEDSYPSPPSPNPGVKTP